jgi:hypothetical protein
MNYLWRTKLSRSRTIWLPPTHPPSPVSKLARRHTGRLTREKGVGEEPNHPIFFDHAHHPQTLPPSFVSVGTNTKLSSRKNAMKETLRRRRLAMSSLHEKSTDPWVGNRLVVSGRGVTPPTPTPFYTLIFSSWVMPCEENENLSMEEMPQ